MYNLWKLFDSGQFQTGPAQGSDNRYRSCHHMAIEEDEHRVSSGPSIYVRLHLSSSFQLLVRVIMLW